MAGGRGKPMRFVPIELGDAGVLAPGRWRWLRTLLWLLALLAVVAGIIIGAGVVQGRLWPMAPHVPPILLPGTLLVISPMPPWCGWANGGGRGS